MDTATLDQDSFRWRDDDGNETGATWLEIANDNHTITMGSGNVNIRLRILVQETAGFAEANFKENWFVQKNGTGGYAAVPASAGAGVETAASAQFVGPLDTTQQVGAGTFLTSNSGLIESSSGPGSTAVPDYAGNDECEFEITLVVVDADVADADFFDFRIYNNGSALTDAGGTYTRTPRLTISKAAGADTFFENRHPIEQGMKPHTAAGMGGVLIE